MRNRCEIDDLGSSKGHLFELFVKKYGKLLDIFLVYCWHIFGISLVRYIIRILLVYWLGINQYLPSFFTNQPGIVKLNMAVLHYPAHSYRTLLILTHTHTLILIYIHLLFSLKTVRKIDISICIHMLRQKSSLDPWPWPFFSPPDCATAVRHSDSTSSGVWVFSQWRTKPDATSSTCGSEGPKLDAVNDCLSNII